MEKFIKYQITPEIDNINSQQAKFKIAPLEKGFGVTLGNALRRTMLSNIPGASVFAIRIPGVTHEFQTINGIKEDVTQIVLNLKGLVIIIDENIHSDEELASLRVEQWPTMKIHFKGQGAIHASDIELPAGFEIVNKDLHIASVTTATGKLEMEIYATRGRGFKTFIQNRESINSLSIIATDSNFSPITRVGYTVDEEKISKQMTGDVLNLDVATTGAITPGNAVAIAAKILSEHLNPLIGISETIDQLKVINEQVEQQKTTTLSIPIEDLNLSVRSYNCLKRRGIQTIQELTDMSCSEVEKIKNLGKKSLREIQKQLTEYGLSFRED
ncbi:MAG: DNA-directed RNA polymerase subunit alpha [Mycoplasmataceae bacterium]|nr:DNA-directed RNA polymerase subunit alpha [Mycoplasmataceae bacterium]